MMHHRLRFILISSLLCLTTAAIANDEELPAAKLLTSDNDDVSIAAVPFETSHKVPAQRNEFQTSHKIGHDAFQRRGDLHQSMRSKEKPELNEQLGELIAADIKNNIEAKRLSEYEKYEIEPLTTTDKPTLTTTETIARSINEGLIDDFAMLEEAGTENKQQSRIQIKKGPNGQDYEYEYVYYYYDDDENKNPGDSDVIISNRKSAASTSTAAPTTKATAAASGQVSAGKASYQSVERGSSSGERNEIQTRGKGRAQALPAPVVEEINEERLPPATRFPQRGKSATSVESAAPAAAVPEGGKKHHPKRPSLELVDSQIFLTDEKEKNSQKGPRVYETEETASKASVEYKSSTVSNNAEEEEEEDEEDTTQSMEKVAFDLYAHIVNENAKEEDKTAAGGSDDDDVEATTLDSEEATTIDEDLTSLAPSTTTTTTTLRTTTTTTTTEPPTTTTTTTTTEAPKGRGGLTAGRNSNRFKFQGRTGTLPTTTEAIAESTEGPKLGRNRFQKPSFTGARGGNSRSSKTTSAPVAEEEEVKKEEAAPQQQSSVSKFRSGGGGAARNRFSLRNNAAASTEKPAAAAGGDSGSDAESTTAKSLVRPRPQFSLRNRARNGPAAGASTTEAAPAGEGGEETPAAGEKEEKATSIVPRPTSRLNIGRPGNRVAAVSGSAAVGQKSRPSPLNRGRVSASADGSDDNKSASENESDAETTTPNNLNKLKSRPRIQINAESKAKKTTAAQPVINRKANPLISKRKFGVTSTTDATVDEHDEHESDNATKDQKEGAKEEASEGGANELKEEDTTPAGEVSTEAPRGIGLLNRRKLVGNRRPGTIK